jgi:hypothetical protein
VRPSAIDHGIGAALQLIVEATIDQPADDRIVELSPAST